MTSGKGPRAILPEATSPAGPPDSSPGSESPGSQIRARPVHEQHRLAGHPVHADLPDRWVHRPGGSGESRPTASTEGPAVPGRPAVWTTPSATSTPVAMTAAEAATASAISTGRRRRRAWDAPWREPGKAPVLTVRDYPRNRVRGARRNIIYFLTQSEVQPEISLVSLLLVSRRDRFRHQKKPDAP